MNVNANYKYTYAGSFTPPLEGLGEAHIFLK
jgi:hypothetical protein